MEMKIEMTKVPRWPVFSCEEVPYSTRLLSVSMNRHREPVVCWISNTINRAPRKMLRCFYVGTEAFDPKESGAAFLGTVCDGPFIWHVFAGIQ